jgi:hypothetical protein
MRRWHFSRLLNAQEVVAPIDEETLVGLSLPLEQAILVEYRLSFAVGDKLAGYAVGGHNGCIASEADVWVLRCALFELRAGSLLFNGRWSDRDHARWQMVQRLGSLSKRWMEVWRRMIQDRNGTLDGEMKEGYEVTLLRERFENIACEEHDKGSDYQGSLVERLELVGMRMKEREIDFMEGLLMSPRRGSLWRLSSISDSNMGAMFRNSPVSLI